MNTPRTSSVILAEPVLGPAQGLILLVGMVVASFAGSFLVEYFWQMSQAFFAGLHAALTHAPVIRIPTTSLSIVAIAGLTGALLSTIWTVSYSLRIGRSVLTLGTARGLAWREAIPRSYLVAAFLATLVFLTAGFLAWIFPPNVAKMNGPVAQLGRIPGWSHVGFLLLALVIAPVVEELAFRGVLIAAFVKRYSVTTAVLVSTMLFVALHAPDKIYYWPGFIDVGLLGLAAAYLRLHYQSLRPAMLAHFLYNALLIVFPLFVHVLL